MMRKDIKDVHTKTIEEIQKMLADAKRELSELMLEAKLGKLQNTRQISLKRWDIARLKTILRGKELTNA